MVGTDRRFRREAFREGLYEGRGQRNVPPVAGRGPWIFVKVDTEEGEAACVDCDDTKSPTAVVGRVEDTPD